jgi:hypothetical protein
LTRSIDPEISKKRRQAICGGGREEDERLRQRKRQRAEERGTWRRKRLKWEGGSFYGRMGDVKMKDAEGAGGPAKAEGGGKAGAAASGQERLAMDDAIMEPWVWEVVKQCVQGGAKPDTLTELLSDGYHGYAQMINLMCEWHVLLGDDKVAVDSEVRGYLKKIILRDFDPTVADSIFEKAGSPPAWLDNMVKDPEWRDLIYELNTKHPGCTLMGYAMAQIQNVGLEAVKMCPEAASANLAMFADMLKLSMAKLCDPSREVTADDVVDLKMLACHNEYAFVFVLSVLRSVGQNEHAPAVRRIAQELHGELVSRGRGRQAEVYASIVSGGSQHEGAMTPLTSMLGQRKTNPSDILTLHKLYTGPVGSRPPGALMQHPAFLDLLVQASFDPKVKINAQFVDKYTWLLAYAVSAKEGDAEAVEEGEVFAANIKAISGVQKLSKDDEQTFSDASLAVLREGIETSRACSMGILHWLGGHLKSPDFYESGGGFERLSPYYVRIIEHVALTHVTQVGPVRLLPSHYSQFPTCIVVFRSRDTCTWRRGRRCCY